MLSFKKGGISFDEFYIMRHIMDKNAFTVKAKESAVYYEKAMDLFTGNIMPESPIVFLKDRGRKIGDLIETDGYGIVLLSDRMINTLREGNFTGWSTFPVEVYDAKGEIINGYSGFSVLGKCGHYDKSLAKDVMLPGPLGNLLPKKIGFFFEPSSWDGSDIFNSEGTWLMVVTGSVKEAIENIKATNIQFIRLTEYVFA